MRLYRVRFSQQWQPENYTVMVREFPPEMTNDEIRIAMERAYPGEVAHVQRGHRSDEAWKHLDEREKYGVKESEASIAHVPI